MSQPDVFFVIGDCVRAANVTDQTMPFITSTSDISVERYYSTSTWSLPSHASLFSTLDAVEHGLTDIGDRLSPDDAVLPSTAQNEGYATSLFSENSVFGAFRGFNQSIDYCDSEINYKLFSTGYSPTQSASSLSPEQVVKGGFDMTPAWAGNIALDLLRHPQRIKNTTNLLYTLKERIGSTDHLEHSHHGERVLTHAVDHLRSQTDSPQLSFINFFDAHNPHHSQPPAGKNGNDVTVTRAESHALASVNAKDVMLKGVDLPPAVASEFETWEEVYARQEEIYTAAIQCLDSLIEKLAHTLETQWDDALVIFLGDHGHLFYEEGFIGHHSWLHPGLIRVPLHISLPSSWENTNTTLRGPLSHSDLAEVVHKVIKGNISNTAEFVAEFDRQKPVVVATDGTCWDKNALLKEYDESAVEMLVAKRAAIIRDDEMTQYERRADTQTVTKTVYTLSETERTVVSGPETAEEIATDRLAEWITIGDKNLGRQIKPRQ